MAILITRTAVIPVWLLASALVVVLTSPSGTAATVLLLLSCGLAAAAILLGKNAAAQPPVFNTPPTPPTIDVRPPLALPAPPADRPPSWPDSGFRNIGRGTKGG